MAETELEKLMSHLAPVDLGAVATPYTPPGAKIRKARKAYSRRRHFRRMWRRRKKRASVARVRSGPLFLPRRRLDGLADKQRIVAAMVPGQWHTRRDLREATGVDFGQVWRMIGKGWVESADDPDAWRSAIAFDGKPFGKRGPQAKLYRLTPEGERQRLLARMLL